MIKPAGRSYLCDACRSAPAAGSWLSAGIDSGKPQGIVSDKDTAFAAAYVSGPGNVIQGNLFRIAACDKGNHIF